MKKLLWALYFVFINLCVASDILAFCENSENTIKLSAETNNLTGITQYIQNYKNYPVKNNKGNLVAYELCFSYEDLGVTTEQTVSTPMMTFDPVTMMPITTNTVTSTPITTYPPTVLDSPLIITGGEDLPIIISGLVIKKTPVQNPGESELFQGVVGLHGAKNIILDKLNLNCSQSSSGLFILGDNNRLTNSTISKCMAGIVVGFQYETDHPASNNVIENNTISENMFGLARAFGKGNIWGNNSFYRNEFPSYDENGNMIPNGDGIYEAAEGIFSNVQWQNEQITLIDNQGNHIVGNDLQVANSSPEIFVYDPETPALSSSNSVKAKFKFITSRPVENLKADFYSVNGDNSYQAHQWLGSTQACAYSSEDGYFSCEIEMRQSLVGQKVVFIFYDKELGSSFFTPRVALNGPPAGVVEEVQNPDGIAMIPIPGIYTSSYESPAPLNILYHDSTPDPVTPDPVVVENMQPSDNIEIPETPQNTEPGLTVLDKPLVDTSAIEVTLNLPTSDNKNTPSTEPITPTNDNLSSPPTDTPSSGSGVTKASAGCSLTHTAIAQTNSGMIFLAITFMFMILGLKRKKLALQKIKNL